MQKNQLLDASESEFCAFWKSFRNIYKNRACVYFPASYLPNHLDEPRFIVDVSNFLILVKMLWTVDCGGSKTIDLISKSSTFSLECFLEDCKDRKKKFNEGTKVAEPLQSEIEQVTATFSGLQRTRKSSARKHHKKHIGIFSILKTSFAAACSS